MFTHLGFFLVSSLLLVSVSGEPYRRRINPDDVKVSNATEMYKHVMSVIKTPNVPCPSGQTRDRFGKCRAVFRRSVPEDSEFDEEVTKCEEKPCCGEGEVMQEMKQEKTGKSHKSEKGRNIALILEKLIKPFLKPKPKPPHHDHHQHSSELEEEEEEEQMPNGGDFPAPPEFRMLNDEICAEKEDGTTGNCIGSTEVPEISGKNEKSPKHGVKRGPKGVGNPDMKITRFLKVLRMRRRLNPVLGRSMQENKQGNAESLDGR